ncbi:MULTISPECIES: MotA/TolQ/ExbB proton channel family protein [Marinobacter]|uniref:MotA/TolQ/ExbB proton channel family protein n=1 Tax=Marinobacter xiaoshiensis TaxID=3073652 RepID=A0ABU2HC67_9GAMM|nr:MULTISPECIES: MotA/TolQ/ExbB proton channel family protein [unclassified Marinobacter]MBK1872240.1 MotA/TolQ/ExbB proton channel family protein [Marinobacter sp. 1-3A]MBK1887104.1 MotA/TolQ/ExbB proton channel family protein [Marinobacter sp. DY40_1A1]MDS1308678.1 MotA/TolQ/ExbB proton channel family protein [Marinobacter sp. F60267]
MGAGISVPFFAQLQGLLVTGGPVVWILAVFSVVAMTIILVKMWQFMLVRAESTADVDAALSLWKKGDRRKAMKALNVQRPISSVVAMAMQGQLNTTDDGILREEVERVATGYLNDLRSFFRPLEMIGSLSPLLGLLGTVMGMIVAFQQMEAAGNQVDPSVLSGGIWQALLTTAVGLSVAIPVVAVHSWLERKVERVSATMSDAVTRVFTCSPTLPPFETAASSEALRNAA